MDARSSTERRTALHWAAIFGYKEVVDAQIEHGASAAICDQNGHTATDLADMCGHDVVFAALAGAEVSINSTPAYRQLLKFRGIWFSAQ